MTLMTTPTGGDNDDDDGEDEGEDEGHAGMTVYALTSAQHQSCA